MKTSKQKIFSVFSFTAVATLAVLATAASAQTADDLRKDGNKSGEVLTYGMGYGQQRYSELTKITPANVKNLTPVWNYSLNNPQGQESQPIIHDGVMYVTTHTATVAINALTGRQIWKTDIEFAPDVFGMACCGLVNRGVAIYNGKVYRTTLDAQVQALDAKTGKEVWKTKAADYKFGHSMTVAPLIAGGVLITGISGGEYGTRGHIDGWDPESGKQVWRRYTIPAPGEKGSDTWPGDTWQKGGGPAWLTGTYDPELDLVYWGVGNGGPWNAEARKGDNLYTNSVLAIRPKTGEIAWHYQFSPNDLYDYDGVNELVQATITVEGKPRKVIMQANRNGFFYVIDRTNGKPVAANQFVKNVNWATGIDKTTWRPLESDVTKKARAGEKIEVWPSAWGGKNWNPMSYSPKTGLAYANTLNWGMPYKLTAPEYKQGQWYLGIDFTGVTWPKGEQGARGYLKAIDPLTGKAKWEMPWDDFPSFSGTMTTASNLLFTGALNGEFMALDANTGKKLWSFQTGSGIVGQPVTWEHKGTQYVTILSGIGGVYFITGDERLASIPAGGSVWTFALK